MSWSDDVGKCGFSDHIRASPCVTKEQLGMDIWQGPNHVRKAVQRMVNKEQHAGQLRLTCAIHCSPAQYGHYHP